MSFTIPGNNTTSFGRTVASNPPMDKNTFAFIQTENKLAKKVKEKIEELIANQAKHGEKHVSNDSDLRRKYKQLCDDG